MHRRGEMAMDNGCCNDKVASFHVADIVHSAGSVRLIGATLLGGGCPTACHSEKSGLLIKLEVRQKSGPPTIAGRALAIVAEGKRNKLQLQGIPFSRFEVADMMI
jgi:hypothetical protein